jgi:uncharacterized membrane protein
MTRSNYLSLLILSAYLGFFEKISGHLPPLSLLKILPGVFVIASLVASIIGIFPVSVFVNLSAPEDIKRYKEDRTNFKSKYLKIAAITLICGFIVLFIASVVSSDTVNTILQPTLMPTP